MRFSGPAAWIAGALSGLLGGLVGHQGGIRSSALFGMPLTKQELVATATAVGLMVDGVSLPIYFWSGRRELAALWPAILAACLAVN